MLKSIFNFVQGFSFMLLLGYVITLVKYSIKKWGRLRQSQYETHDEEMRARISGEFEKKTVFKVLGEILLYGFFGMIVILVLLFLTSWLSVKIF